jgi:two-component system, LuxR family, sensor kinase FixL
MIWYSASEFITDVDWIFIVEIPGKIVLKQLGMILLPVNIMIIIFLSIIFILVIILSGRLMKPLQVLTHTLSQYGIDGNVNPIQIKASSEVNSAIHAFNRMLEERDKLEKEVLEITETERRRIGLDLHDDLGQILTGIAFQVVMIEDDYKKNCQPDISYIREISNLIDEAINKTKMIARGLCPVNLFDNGLIIAVEEFGKNIEKLYGIHCEIKNEVVDLIKDDIICVSLYYIIKEAINNSCKHSKTGIIKIHFYPKDFDLILTVKDNGIGFVPDKKNSGLGLRTMKYRAKLIQADLEIQSSSESGTLVTCRLKNYLGVKA